MNYNCVINTGLHVLFLNDPQFDSVTQTTWIFVEKTLLMQHNLRG